MDSNVYNNVLFSRMHWYQKAPLGMALKSLDQKCSNELDARPTGTLLLETAV